MLDVIREGVKKPWVKIIIFVIIVSFVFAGYFTSSFFLGDPNAIATVNGKSISYKDFQSNYLAAKSRYGDSFNQIFSTPEQIQNFREQVLQNIISRQVLLQFASEQGMRVSVEQLRQAIQSMPALQLNGQYSPELLDQLLLSRGWSREEFKRLFASDLVFSQLLNGITKTSFSSDKLIAVDYEVIGQKRSGRVLRIPHQVLQDSVTISNDEIEAYYQAHTENYRLPEKVKLDFIELSINDLVKAIEIKEDELKQYYQDHIDRYRKAEQKRYAHILISEGDGDAEPKQKANELYQRIIAGEKFEELAKNYSDDEFSAENGGDLGLNALEDMGEEFSEISSKLNQVGDVSEPFKSSFGYHIFKVTEVVPGEQIPFEEVKEQITNILKTQKAEETYYQKLDLLKEKSFEYADSLKESSEATGLPIKESDWVSRGEREGLFADQAAQEAIFSDEVLLDKLNSSVIELSDSHAIVLRVKAHEASRVQTIDEVREQIRAVLISEKQAEAARQLAEEFKTAILEKADLSQRLLELKLKLIDLNNIDRANTTLNFAENQAFFKMSAPQQGRPGFDIVTHGQTTSLLILNEVVPGKWAEAEKDIREQMKKRAESFYANIEMELLLNSLRKDADVKRHLERLERFN